MSILTCQDVSLGYEGNAIVDHLSFSVSSGDYLCIVGENGSGKTTLMKTILGLTAPIRGKVLTGDGLHQTEIGYLPQQTDVQKDFPASVWEIVLSGFLNQSGFHPFYTKEQKKTANEILEKLHISNLKNRCYRELSGGQQQRVLLARALCATKKILLLDEPVTGLDPNATAELYTIIHELNKEGVTIIMISHDIDASLQYASHILHFGNDVFFGTKQAYLKSDMGKKSQDKGGASK